MVSTARSVTVSTGVVRQALPSPRLPARRRFTGRPTGRPGRRQHQRGLAQADRCVQGGCRRGSPAGNISPRAHPSNRRSTSLDPRASATTVRWRDRESRSFFCPSAATSGEYQHKEAQALVERLRADHPASTSSTNVYECQGCHRQYDEHVISSPPTSDLSTRLQCAIRAAAVLAMLDGDPYHEPSRTKAVSVVRGAGLRHYTETDLDADLRSMDVSQPRRRGTTAHDRPRHDRPRAPAARRRPRGHRVGRAVAHQPPDARPARPLAGTVARQRAPADDPARPGGRGHCRVRPTPRLSTRPGTSARRIRCASVQPSASIGQLEPPLLDLGELGLDLPELTAQLGQACVVGDHRGVGDLRRQLVTPPLQPAPVLLDLLEQEAQRGRWTGFGAGPRADVGPVAVAGRLAASGGCGRGDDIGHAAVVPTPCADRLGDAVPFVGRVAAGHPAAPSLARSPRRR